ncbi:MAG: VOC family protein [Sphingomonas sp.]|uniref:VOC family protein n=1 Tax=Sphingomonas sp. TaxID=28214 RepID=UPI00262B0CB3|nr:VOC family protein [Sphingomonas sp.]MDK2770020.1 VOC family protein [Sphingomonas sp.]
MVDFTFHHGAVSVPSLDEAADWYGRVMGFSVEKKFEIPAISARVAMLRKGPLRMEVFEVTNAAPLPDDRRVPNRDLQTHGNKHVAFRVADLDATIAELEAMGVEIVFVVREKYGSGAFIRDCAGNLIEFVCEPED